MDKQKSSRGLVAFVHIEKAAGTTLLYLLRRNFPGRYLDVRPLARRDPPGLFTHEDLRAVLRLNPFLRAIGGHSVTPGGGLERVDPDIRYVTLLREPVARYLSQFQYWNRVLGKAWSFERFLDHEPSWNFQTRKIAGVDDPARAYAALDARFAAVGTVERFDAFLLQLSAVLAPLPFDPRYRVRNRAGGEGADSAVLLASHGEAIRERNASDLALYARVCDELLPARAAAFPGDLDAAVDAFRRQLARRPAPRVDLPLLFDAALRKGWYEPLTGLARRRAGLPARGSY